MEAAAVVEGALVETDAADSAAAVEEISVEEEETLTDPIEVPLEALISQPPDLWETRKKGLIDKSFVE